MHERGKQLSRRTFVQQLTQILTTGSLIHFFVSDMYAVSTQQTVPYIPQCPGGGHMADNCLPRRSRSDNEDDYCPGGMDEEDVCAPDEGYEDYCPGERSPEDNCPPGGIRPEDVCDTGVKEADICSPVIVDNKSADQCASGNSADDVCPEDGIDNRITDKCHSGYSPEPDACPYNGSLADGDNCPGGPSVVDNCLNGEGDQCSESLEYIDGEDTCGAVDEDICGTTPDKCIHGKNTNMGLGYDDMCGERKVLGFHVGYASDDCHDGGSSQDTCDGNRLDPNSAEGREEDVCLPTSDGEIETEDICHPAAPIASNDICYMGLPSSDMCIGITCDSDECPGGRANVDMCSDGYAPEDECPSGRNECDVCNAWLLGSDECVTPQLIGQVDSLPPDCPVLESDHVE